MGERDTILKLKKRLKRAAQSKRELQRRMFHLKTLYDLSREVGFLIDAQEIMRNLLMMTIGTFGTFRGLIVLVDLDGNRVESVLERGVEDECRVALTRAVEAGHFVELTAIDGLQRLRGSKSRARPKAEILRLLASFEIHLWIAFRVKEHLWGGVGLGDKLSGDPYSKDDEELLTTLCNQGAGALKNAVTHQEVVRYAAELEASLQRIQILESIKSHLTKFVPKTVQELIEESPEAPSFDKRELDVSVLFADITGYTRVSSEMELDQVNRLVERYFGAFLDEILRRGGDVNETAGDGLMVIFRKRDPRRHARAAVLAALGIQRRTREINAELHGRFQPITMKVGVNSGIAAVGATKIEGAAGTRWTYTASGPTTNVAARVAALAEGGTVIVSEETRSRLADEFCFEDLGPQTLKNVPKPVRVYRVAAPEPAGDRSEHRRHPRRPVTWPVRIWIGEECVPGRAVDASAYGVCVVTIPTAMVQPGQPCRIEILADPDSERSLSGEVRYVSDRGFGVATQEPLPPGP